MVDAAVSKTVAPIGRVGSTPTFGTSLLPCSARLPNGWAYVLIMLYAISHAISR